MATLLLLASLLLFLTVIVVLGSLSPQSQQQQRQQEEVHSNDAPASTPAPSKDDQRGNETSGGVNVLAAVLVTALSLMVFMALKYSGCEFAGSSNSSSAASESGENESISEDIEASGMNIIHNSTTVGDVSANSETAAQTSKKKKPSSKFVVESIDKFTVLTDYESFTRRQKKVGKLSCSVCLSEFRSKSEIRLLPSCNHFFHPECIDLWLVSNMTCPVCRRSVIPCTGEVGSSTNTAGE